MINSYLKTGVFFLLFFVSIVGYSQFRAGAGITMPVSQGDAFAGFQLKGTYAITEAIEVSGAFSHIFNSFINWNAIDIDGAYVFPVSEQVGIFPEAGLLVNMVSYTGWGGSRISDTNAGINLGVGSNISITEKFILVPDIRYSFVEGGGYMRINLIFQYVF